MRGEKREQLTELSLNSLGFPSLVLCTGESEVSPRYKFRVDDLADGCVVLRRKHVDLQQPG